LNEALGRRWKYFGVVPADRLRVIYGSCFAFIYPSSYEGFGLPILEAMACGAPAVVACLSAFPEVGGDAALYAESQTPKAYASHLQSLMASEHRAAKVREGIAHARQFSWDTTFARTLESYRRLANGEAVAPLSCRQ
jgi:mannosyltransferase